MDNHNETPDYRDTCEICGADLAASFNPLDTPTICAKCRRERHDDDLPEF